MSILGVKKNIEKEFRKMEISNRYLRRSVAVLTIKVLNVKNNFENTPDKTIISLNAGIEGPVHTNQRFDFGDGGGSYYVMNFPGQILGISLVGLRANADDLNVIITVNNNEQYGYGMGLRGSATNGYDNFNLPLEVKAGDIIGFVSKSDNTACINTLVTAVIELFL